MPRIVLPLLLACLSVLALPARAAAQPTPEELLERVYTDLLPRSAGVREYSLVVRSPLSEVTVYARRGAEEWEFQHDAEGEDFSGRMAPVALEFALFIVDESAFGGAGAAETAGIESSVVADTVRGRAAHRLHLRFPGGFVEDGITLDSMDLAFDSETLDVVRVMVAGRPEAEEGESFTKPWKMFLLADLYDYADLGGVRFPRRFRVSASGVLPPEHPEQTRQAMEDLRRQRKEGAGLLPGDEEAARRIGRIDQMLELMRTGEVTVEYEVRDFRVNAGVPPGVRPVG